MIKSLQRFLTSFLKSNDWIYNSVIVTLVILAIVVWRCERKKGLEMEVEYQTLEYKNELQELEIKVLTRRNKLLYDEIDSIHVVIDTLDKQGLKDLFSNYRTRYYLP